MTVLSGILDVVTFVNYNVFATKQTGESDSDNVNTRIQLKIVVGNFLFLAVYTVSNKNLKSKIEGNVVASLVL
jgi:hypothetical protein